MGKFYVLGTRYWLGCLLVASLWRLFGHVQLGGNLGADQNKPEGLYTSHLARERLYIPQEELESLCPPRPVAPVT